MSTTETKKSDKKSAASAAKKKTSSRKKSSSRKPTYVEIIQYNSGELLDEEARQAVENHLGKK